MRVSRRRGDLVGGAFVGAVRDSPLRVVRANSRPILKALVDVFRQERGGAVSDLSCRGAGVDGLGVKMLRTSLPGVEAVVPDDEASVRFCFCLLWLSRGNFFLLRMGALQRGPSIVRNIDLFFDGGDCPFVFVNNFVARSDSW